jgi:hypothetical protein
MMNRKNEDRVEDDYQKCKKKQNSFLIRRDRLTKYNLKIEKKYEGQENLMRYYLIRKKMNVLNFFRRNFDKKEEEKKGKKHFF